MHTKKRERERDVCYQHLRNKYREELADRASLTTEKIDKFVKALTDDVRDGTWQNGGWAERNPPYNVSKAAVNGYVTVLDRELRQRQQEEGHSRITVNSFCPGWTKTDMTDGSGSEDIAGAVKTGVWLALCPPGTPSGKFWADGHEHPWE